MGSAASAVGGAVGSVVHSVVEVGKTTIRVTSVFEPYIEAGNRILYTTKKLVRTLPPLSRSFMAMTFSYEQEGPYRVVPIYKKNQLSIVSGGALVVINKIRKLPFKLEEVFRVPNLLAQLGWSFHLNVVEPKRIQDRKKDFINNIETMKTEMDTALVVPRILLKRVKKEDEEEMLPTPLKEVKKFIDPVVKQYIDLGYIDKALEINRNVMKLLSGSFADGAERLGHLRMLMKSSVSGLSNYTTYKYS